MLVLRAAARSRLGLNVIPTSIRNYRPTPRYFYQPLVQPYTWKTRLWYRPDGTSRSKWKGAFYAATALSILVLITSLQEAVDQLYLLSLLIQVQRVDAKYSEYDLSNAADVVAYLTEVEKCIPHGIPDEDIDRFKQALQHLMEIAPEVHGILREHLEKLHNIIVTQDPDQDLLDVAEVVLQTLTDLGNQLVELAQRVQGLASISLKDQKSNGEDAYGIVG
ncbi:hypothetical protein P691DRAFT_666286 [Macrolepiota fuliginosa MF-IS2]|uniref:Uncharacterized protein n=1 Tax=Macrolepiota fuliginosa MF-IS2 TaxID=1400762 RepID=A0A9P5XEQ2_9AGAR|nr:hypothetical protein P691DRAFT_666286 [Macrolepiota fuliginosa MF-IS2]